MVLHTECHVFRLEPTCLAASIPLGYFRTFSPQLPAMDEASLAKVHLSDVEKVPFLLMANGAQQWVSQRQLAAL
jgi:hypothetical protein